MPMRPTVLISPILAIPTTKVENTKGAIIILIRRKKISVKAEKISMVLLSVLLGVENSELASVKLSNSPTIMPSTSAIAT